MSITVNRARSCPPVAGLVGLMGAALLVAVCAGCAGGRRPQLERVAKDWCETIRASQVVPVYPLTEDLEPGDVFLVQTSIQAETDIYRRKGFLPLDDRRVRLREPGYAEVYFDGFWRDTWGAGRHPRVDRAGAGPAAGGGRLLLTAAEAPRAAFPSYSFEVRRSGGLGLALPIKGVPVGLSYLGSDRATGSVTIADARTYGGDSWTLYSSLLDWAERPEVRVMLADTVEQSGRPVFLRVVSRVYLTGAVVVGMHADSTRGAQATAGAAPQVSVLNTDGSVNENFNAALAALSESADPSPAQAGGRVKFVQATSRDVVLAESFDRLLSIGYLGFDVPVFEGGVLGAPIPTYERLEGLVREPAPAAGRLTGQEVRANMHIDALAGQAMIDATTSVPADAPAEAADRARRARTFKNRALKIMSAAAASLGGREFTSSKQLADAALALGPDDQGLDRAFEEAAKNFRTAARRYIAADGGGSRNDRAFTAEVERAFGEEHGFIKP